MPGPRALQLLEFIRSEIKAGRPFPKSDRICQHMGWKHENSAKDALLGLAANRLLKVKAREMSKGGWRYTYELMVDK